MPDKQQTIETMANELYNRFGTMLLAKADSIAVSVYLYNENYRKVGKNAVVFTEEEYDDLMKRIGKVTRELGNVVMENERLYNIKLDLEHQLTQSGLTEYVGADVIEAETRKEMAKEILENIKTLAEWGWEMSRIEKWICKNYGVEVEE